MVLPLIAAAAPLLIELAGPLVKGLFEKDSTAEKIATTAVNVAAAVTGKASPDEALTALRASPELLVKYQEQMNAHASDMYREETKRLEAINETMRTEAQAGDWYVRRMRPTFGYMLIAKLAGQAACVIWTAFEHPELVSEIAAAMASLSGIDMTALAVLGIYVYKRGAGSLGSSPQNGDNPLSAITRLFRK